MQPKHDPQSVVATIKRSWFTPLAGAVVGGAVAVCGVAYAQGPGDNVTVKTTVPAGGTAAKPKPVGLTWSLDVSGANPGDRAATPSEYDFTWARVQEAGKNFPVCTAAAIDAAQSDAGCNPKARVAKGTINALVGPAGRPDSNASCDLSFVIYNGGARKASLYASAEPSKCAGIQYVPPLSMTWSKKGHTSTLALPVPDNIAHPLPGVEGGFIHFDFKFDKLKTTVGKGRNRHTSAA